MDREALAVAIVTYRRAQQLERCLRSLATAARGSDFRLRTRISINGPDAESAAVLERISREEPALELAFVTRDSSSTPAAARNALLKDPGWASPAVWICFLDDDAFVDPDFLDQFRRARAALPDAAAIGGPNLTPMDASGFASATGLVLSSRLATFLSFSRYRPSGLIRFTNENELTLCNLFFRLDALGSSPFPEELFCGEENRLLNRMEARGLRLGHDPLLRVWHDRRSTPGSLGIQVLRYGRGRGENLKESPQRTDWIRLVPLLCLIWTITELTTSLARGGLPSPLWMWACVLYFALCIEEAFRMAIVQSQSQTSRVKSAALAIPLFAWIHACYGAGLALGLLRFRRRNS